MFKYQNGHTNAPFQMCKVQTPIWMGHSNGMAQIEANLGKKVRVMLASVWEIFLPNQGKSWKIDLFSVRKTYVATRKVI